MRATLLRSSAEPITITAVRGTGGYGKTTLAMQICQDAAVQNAFPGGVLWLELGQGIGGAALAARINDLTARLTGKRLDLIDPQQAGFQFGEALDSISWQTLLVLDDVWYDEQVLPFLQGGRLCRRLITTRRRLRSLSDATSLEVDIMLEEQASAILRHQAPDLSRSAGCGAHAADWSLAAAARLGRTQY